MTEQDEVAVAGRRNFYGRRHGKTLKDSQRTYLAQDLVGLAPAGLTPDSQRLAERPPRARIDPAAIFGNDRPLWLEVGFGGGEHLVHQAATNPQVGIIGCEPFLNGVAMLLGKIRRAGVNNLRVYPGDVRDLFDVLPDAVIDRAFLLYPDPWPKRRHNDRRFVTPGYLGELARVMQPGAVLRVATDIPDYVRQTLIEVPKAGFARLTPGAIHDAWPDWHPTRYEQKALREGRIPHYLTFARLAPGGGTSQ